VPVAKGENPRPSRRSRGPGNQAAGALHGSNAAFRNGGRGQVIEDDELREAWRRRPRHARNPAATIEA